MFQGHSHTAELEHVHLRFRKQVKFNMFFSESRLKKTDSVFIKKNEATEISGTWKEQKTHHLPTHTAQTRPTVYNVDDRHTAYSLCSLILRKVHSLTQYGPTSHEARFKNHNGNLNTGKQEGILPQFLELENLY